MVWPGPPQPQQPLQQQQQQLLQQQQQQLQLQQQQIQGQNPGGFPPNSFTPFRPQGQGNGGNDRRQGRDNRFNGNGRRGQWGGNNNNQFGNPQPRNGAPSRPYAPPNGYVPPQTQVEGGTLVGAIQSLNESVRHLQQQSSRAAASEGAPPAVDSRQHPSRVPALAGSASANRHWAGATVVRGVQFAYVDPAGLRLAMDCEAEQVPPGHIATIASSNHPDHRSLLITAGVSLPGGPVYTVEEALIDSGAQVSLMSGELAGLLGAAELIQPVPAGVGLLSADRRPMDSVGILKVQLHLKD